MTTPNEQYEANSFYDNLAGTEDSGTGIPYMPASAGPNSSPSVGVHRRRRDNRLFNILTALREGMVVKEASLEIGIWSINYLFMGTLKAYNGATGESVTDDATNYLYINSSNTLVINTTGFPSTNDHLPLAEVVCADGSISSITDRRDRVIFAVGADITGTEADTLTDGSNADSLHVHTLDSGVSDVTATASEINQALDGISANVTDTNLNTLTGASNADSLHTHAASGIESGAVGTSELANAVADMIPKVDLTVGSESSNTIQAAIQIQDAQGNSLSQRLLVHAWLSDSQYGSECTAAPNTSTGWSTGTELEEITADKRWTAITDANGRAVLDISDSGTPTFYLNIEIDGRIYTSSAITFA